MQYPHLKLALLAASFLTFSASSALADPSFGNFGGNTTAGSVPTSNSSMRMPPPNPVMSPEQFSSTVKSMHQQNLTNLNQQVAQQFTQQRPTWSSNNPQPTGSSPGAATPSQASASAPSQASTSRPAAPAAPAQPEQPAPYSGFGSTGSAPASGNSGSNSGWAVQY